MFNNPIVYLRLKQGQKFNPANFKKLNCSDAGFYVATILNMALDPFRNTWRRNYRGRKTNEWSDYVSQPA